MAVTNSEEFHSSASVENEKHSLPTDRGEGQLWLHFSPSGDWVNFRIILGRAAAPVGNSGLSSKYLGP